MKWNLKSPCFPTYFLIQSKKCILSPEQGGLHSFRLTTRGHLQAFSSHWLPKSRPNEPKYTPKVTNSSHLSKVNQSQRRPLIPANLSGSARKQIKPCAQIRYKILPLSRPSTMLVELGIDLQLRNWKPCATIGEHRLWNEAKQHSDLKSDHQCARWN